ncbi:MAG: NAD(P)H-dependent oxidoreductase [Verrucomicrobia bacterium Tous-C9LFEB]|nr:MAG: NAD(P)H-dependent oxidoreductase [Verrucomicrobia bacterium Tous-C9LFEB]
MHTTTHISIAQLLTQLEWRYAVKKFDPAQVIAPEIWTAIEQALVLTPSSFGVQPWKFFVITNRQLKEQLVAHTFGQRQVADASHLVFFAANATVTLSDIDHYIRRIASVRQSDIESLEPYRQRLISTLVEGPKAKTIFEWTSQQSYIALGNFLTSAALLGVDACPIGGFNPAEYDKVLGLTERGLRSVVVAAAGYRDPEDKYASAPKVRFDPTHVIEHLA